MDVNNLLEQLLQAGKDAAQKGQTIAEQKLGIPAEGEQRESMLAGAKTGAAVAGLLAVLLGTSAGRKVTGVGLKLGSLAAVGGLAYQLYNQWQGDKNTQAPVDAADKGTLVDTAPSALLPPPMPPALSSDAILKAMIAAAKADGHID